MITATMTTTTGSFATSHASTSSSESPMEVATASATGPLTTRRTATIEDSSTTTNAKPIIVGRDSQNGRPSSTPRIRFIPRPNVPR